MLFAEPSTGRKTWGTDSGRAEHVGMRIVPGTLSLPLIVSGRSLGFLWYAHVCNGSEVMGTVLALTEPAARRRAQRAIDQALRS